MDVVLFVIIAALVLLVVGAVVATMRKRRAGRVLIAPSAHRSQSEVER